jgi:hypothetical protein
MHYTLYEISMKNDGCIVTVPDEVSTVLTFDSINSQSRHESNRELK